MDALSNIWNNWLAFMQDHPVLAPAIIAVVLLATFADLIKNGYIAGQPPKHHRKETREDEEWVSSNSHRY